MNQLASTTKAHLGGKSVAKVPRPSSCARICWRWSGSSWALQAVMKHEGTLPKRLRRTFKELTE